VARDLGLETLDLAESFRAAKWERPDERLTFENDEHWRASGHVAVADAITRRVTEE
jgi:hypothetical protein